MKNNVKGLELMKKPVYGIVDNGLFGLRIVSGIVTGIRYTEDKPVFEVSFGKDRWWISSVAQSKEELIGMFDLAPLERVNETHGLKIKYDY